VIVLLPFSLSLFHPCLIWFPFPFSQQWLREEAKYKISYIANLHAQLAEVNHENGHLGSAVERLYS
jgi:hypothetical protein